MTTQRYFSFCCFTALLILIACSSDDDEAPEAEPSQFVTFEASGSASGSYIGSGSIIRTDEDGAHRLTFEFTDGTSFRLEFIDGPEGSPPAIPSAGEYSVAGLGGLADFSVVYTDLAEGRTYLGPADGSLTITATDGTAISGNFEFTASSISDPDNPLVVSDGVFTLFTPE